MKQISLNFLNTLHRTNCSRRIYFILQKNIFFCVIHFSRFLRKFCVQTRLKVLCRRSSVALLNQQLLRLWTMAEMLHFAPTSVAPDDSSLAGVALSVRLSHSHQLSATCELGRSCRRRAPALPTLGRSPPIFP